MKKVKYRTWVSKGKIVLFSMVSLLLILLPAFTDWGTPSKILMWLAAIPFTCVTFYLSLTYNSFAPTGGDYQNKIYDLVIDNVSLKYGRLLDIGTFSGALPIKFAKERPDLEVFAVEKWPENIIKRRKNSKKVSLSAMEECQENAKLEGVSERVTFTDAPLTRLPYKNNAFDAVVSVLSYQQSSDSHKGKMLDETFRVLKDGGEFLLIDLFKDEYAFGDDVEKLFYKFNLSEIEIKPLEEVMELPKILKTNKNLGNAVYVKGKK